MRIRPRRSSGASILPWTTLTLLCSMEPLVEVARRVALLADVDAAVRSNPGASAPNSQAQSAGRGRRGAGQRHASHLRTEA